MLKIAVFAPIPMANESTAATVKAGAAAKARRACRTSCSKMPMQAVIPPDGNVLQQTHEAHDGKQPSATGSDNTTLAQTGLWEITCEVQHSVTTRRATLTENALPFLVTTACRPLSVGGLATFGTLYCFFVIDHESPPPIPSAKECNEFVRRWVFTC